MPKTPDPLDFTSPAGMHRRALEAMARPWRAIARPKCFGLDNIPTRSPVLFVGNHTVYGVTDAPLMVLELYRLRGVFPRILGDHFHFEVPLWREFLTWGGVVDGTRENCGRLMDAQQAILVFPGGGRETLKRKGEKYRLIWKERLGFCRMAMRHGYSIIPFGAVGAEDLWDIVADANDFLATPLGAIYRSLGFNEDYLAPISKGLGPTLIPRPERLYFGFGRPIATRKLKTLAEDPQACAALRDRVRDAVSQQVEFLLCERDQDPHRYPAVIRALGLEPKPGKP